jgi:hypothetical protein
MHMKMILAWTWVAAALPAAWGSRAQQVAVFCLRDAQTPKQG